MTIRDDMRYTREHLWLRESAASWRAGLTDYAQELIGEISFIDLPAPGSTIGTGGKLLTIEGLKSVIDIGAPYPLTVIATNKAVADDPSLVNRSPYDDGWIIDVSPPASGESPLVLSAPEYRSVIGQ